MEDCNEIELRVQLNDEINELAQRHDGVILFDEEDRRLLDEIQPGFRVDTVEKAAICRVLLDVMRWCDDDDDVVGD